MYQIWLGVIHTRVREKKGEKAGLYSASISLAIATKKIDTCKLYNIFRTLCATRKVLQYSAKEAS